MITKDTWHANACATKMLLLDAAKPNPIWSDPMAISVCKVGSFRSNAAYHKVEGPNYVSDPSFDTYFPPKVDNYVFQHEH